MVWIHPGPGAGVCMSLFVLQHWTQRGCQCFLSIPYHSAFLGSFASRLPAGVCRCWGVCRCRDVCRYGGVCTYQEDSFSKCTRSWGCFVSVFGFPLTFFEGSRVALTWRRAPGFRIIWCISFHRCSSFLPWLGCFAQGFVITVSMTHKETLMRYWWDLL